jgi:hypothetical protein
MFIQAYYDIKYSMKVFIKTNKKNIINKLIVRMLIKSFFILILGSFFFFKRTIQSDGHGKKSMPKGMWNLLVFTFIFTVSKNSSFELFP